MDSTTTTTTGRRFAVAATATAAVLVLGGCGGDSSPSSPSPAARPKAKAPATPTQRLDLGVVRLNAVIGGELESSAGVVHDAARGLILTTAHGVWGASSLKVNTGIAVLHGRIVARSACDDLALVETQPRLPGLVAVPPSADGSALAGRPLVAVHRRAGLPAGGAPELVTRRVTAGAGPARLLPGVRPAKAVALDGGLPPSATGAPVIGSDGRLAGLAQVTQQGGVATTTVLPWATIDQRLRELRPGGQAQYVGWRRHYRCSGALQRYTAARHPGFKPGDARLNAPVPATRLAGTEEVDG